MSPETRFSLAKKRSAWAEQREAIRTTGSGRVIAPKTRRGRGVCEARRSGDAGKGIGHVLHWGFANRRWQGGFRCAKRVTRRSGVRRHHAEPVVVCRGGDFRRTALRVPPRRRGGVRIEGAPEVAQRELRGRKKEQRPPCRPDPKLMDYFAQGRTQGPVSLVTLKLAISRA